MKILKDEKTGLYYREGTFDLGVIREQSSYNKLFELVEGKIVLDIGGNIGAFAYNALKNGAKRVASFEPEPENIRIFKMQKLKNVKLFEYAVSDKDGKASFYVNKKKNKGLHSLQEKKGRDCIEVKTISFEKVLKTIKPQIIKIDIEGGEYNLDFNLIPDSVEGIAVEIHLLTKKNRERGKKLLKYLKNEFEELSNTKITDTTWALTFIGKRKK